MPTLTQQIADAWREFYRLKHSLAAFKRDLQKARLQLNALNARPPPLSLPLRALRASVVKSPFSSAPPRSHSVTTASQPASNSAAGSSGKTFASVKPSVPMKQQSAP